jgi:hypothetical protein
MHLIDLVTGPFRPDLGRDRRGKFVIGGVGAEHGPQIEFACGEQTVAQHPLGGEAHPVT